MTLKLLSTTAMVTLLRCREERGQEWMPALPFHYTSSRRNPAASPVIPSPLQGSRWQETGSASVSHLPSRTALNPLCFLPATTGSVSGGATVLGDWFAVIKNTAEGRKIVCMVCGGTVSLEQAILSPSCEWVVCSDKCLEKCQSGYYGEWLYG